MGIVVILILLIVLLSSMILVIVSESEKLSRKIEQQKIYIAKLEGEKLTSGVYLSCSDNLKIKELEDQIFKLEELIDLHEETGNILMIKQYSYLKNRHYKELIDVFKMLLNYRNDNNFQRLK